MWDSSYGSKFLERTRLGKSRRKEAEPFMRKLLLAGCASRSGVGMAGHGIDVVRLRHSGVLTKYSDFLVFTDR